MYIGNLAHSWCRGSKLQIKANGRDVLFGELVEKSINLAEVVNKNVKYVTTEVFS